MKRILPVLLIVLSFVSLALASEKDITSHDAKTLLEKNRNVYLLDVRTPKEFSQARLPGAVLIPIGEFERRAGEVPKNRPVLVYCAVGSRSKQVAGYLAQHGSKEVYNMSDGIVGWYRNGFPTSR
jgi:rhodanese-related sulfurtransferase